MPKTHIRTPRQVFIDGFRRSRKGNLWREYDGETLTVFPSVDGGYVYCRVGPDGKRYSTRDYETEEEALWALWEVVP